MLRIVNIPNPTVESVVHLMDEDNRQVFTMLKNPRGSLVLDVGDLMLISIANKIADGRNLFFYLEDLEEESENE